MNGWCIWSTRTAGVLNPPQPIRKLPAKAELSADGMWAELRDRKGIAKVFMRLDGKATSRDASDKAA